MDDNLKAQTRARIDEIGDLIRRQPVGWQGQVDDRLELLRRAYGVGGDTVTKPMKGDTNMAGGDLGFNPDFWRRPPEDVARDLEAHGAKGGYDAALATVEAVQSFLGHDPQAPPTDGGMKITRIQAPLEPGGGDPSPDTLEESEAGRQR